MGASLGRAVDSLLPVGTRRRWEAAYYLNKLPRQCWTDLVSWALGEDDHGMLAPDLKCRTGADFDRNGMCYCGKRRDMSRPEIAAMFKDVS